MKIIKKIVIITVLCFAVFAVPVAHLRTPEETYQVSLKSHGIVYFTEYQELGDNLIRVDEYYQSSLIGYELINDKPIQVDIRAIEIKNKSAKYYK